MVKIRNPASLLNIFVPFVLFVATNDPTKAGEPQRHKDTEEESRFLVWTFVPQCLCGVILLFGSVASL
ncbi:MAG: hypothetical protein LUQ29_06915, partial [Methylococcaceae bacterium]|nr:hypothetical protein [Methylococcaceae bacterium]